MPAEQFECKELQASLQPLNETKSTYSYEIVPLPLNCILKYTKNKLTRTRSASDRTNFIPPFVTISYFHKPHEALKITGKEKQQNPFAYAAKRKLNISELLRFRNGSIKLPPRAKLTLVASSFSTEIQNRKFSSCGLSHIKKHYTIQGPSDTQSRSKPWRSVLLFSHLKEKEVMYLPIDKKALQKVRKI